MAVISGMMNLLTGSIARIEQKVDHNQQFIREMAQNLGVLADKLAVQKEDFDRRLEMMKSKQEMILLKQDQLQSTLYGETTSPVFTTSPPCTPRIPLNTRSIPIHSVESHSDVASALESCDLESLLSKISWSPPEIVLQPPPKVKLHKGTLGAIAIPQQGTLAGSSTVDIPQQGTLAGSSTLHIPQQGTLAGSSGVGIPQQGTLAGSSAAP